MNDTPSLTPFDAMTFSSQLQIIKAMVPYLANSQQKFVSVFIKFQELQNTYQLFQTNKNGLSACSEDSDQINPMDLLSEIQNYCSPKERENINMIVNFYQVMQMYSSFQDAEGDSDSSDSTTLDQLKMFLSPEQQAMFDTYSSMFQNEGGES